MSVLIKGIGIPESCAECRFCVNGFTDNAPLSCSCSADGMRKACMMTSMTTFFKQLLCRHDWIRRGDRYIQHEHYIVPKARFVCRKCGKEIYK